MASNTSFLTDQQRAQIKIIDGDAYIPVDAVEYHFPRRRQRSEIFKLGRELVIAGEDPINAVTVAERFMNEFFKRIVKPKET